MTDARRDGALLVDRAAEIAALGNQPALRNLLITQCYHDLSSEIARLLGSRNVNWCTFATWASKTAGRFIRNDEIPRPFRARLEASAAFRRRAARILDRLDRLGAAHTLTQHGLLSLAEEVMGDVSDQIAAGNLKVFSELAPVFARFIHLFDGGALDAKAAEALLDGLRDGPSDRGGQSLLREAMRHLLRATWERDPDIRAVRMLVANAQTGLHEQIRLQPYIAGSLDAPVSNALRRVWRHHALDPADGSPAGPVHAVWDRLGAALAADAERAWREFATDELMTLAVPGQTLHLGRRLPPPPDQPLYPPALAAIRDHEAVELLEHYDALDPTATGEVGADDWTALSQRMRYIIALVRSRQQVSGMLGQPFSAAQRSAILARRVPAGPL